jgi:xanthine/CO dehydrogenase XdhC/CoxF family maturation factor
VAALAEWLRPPPHLFLFGAGPDVVPVVALARGLGWTVSVWDPRARPQSRMRFAAAGHVHTRALVGVRVPIDASHCPLAVVMSHDREVDRRALEMLIASRARYIGVLGPRRRTDRLLAELARTGVDMAAAAPRLHAPVGLAIGAETPDEIALSIVAQAQAVAAGARARQGAAVKSRRAAAEDVDEFGPPAPWLVAQ